MYPRYPYEGVLCVGLGGIQHPFPLSAPRRWSMARATGAPGACPTNGVMVWIRRVFLSGHCSTGADFAWCMLYFAGWREERPTPDNWDGPTPKCLQGWSEIFECLNGFRMRVACLQPLMFIQLTTCLLAVVDTCPNMSKNLPFAGTAQQISEKKKKKKKKSLSNSFALSLEETRDWPCRIGVRLIKPSVFWKTGAVLVFDLLA